MLSEPVIILGEPPQAGLARPAGRSGHVSTAPAMSVEIATPERFFTIEREWRDLTGRALAGNAFMEPSLVAAAAHADGVRVHVLLAWASLRPGEPIRLAGAWAFACRHPSSDIPVQVLKTPVHGHAGLGIPVLDAGLAAAVLAQMLDAVAEEPDLPKLIEINGFDGEGPVASLLMDELARRGSRHVELERRCRPQLVKGVAEAAPLSASRERALRQKRRRLARSGQLSCTVHCTQDEVHAALDEFLALEVAGWKGKAIERGHAIRRELALEAFFGPALDGLAAHGLVRITALRSDGRPVAMQVTIRSGATAFTWKSTYDEARRDCGPGLLLLQDVTAALLADPAIGAVDSCNHRDDGYMAEFWSGRKPVLDMVLDVRRGRTLGFSLLSSSEFARQWLKAEARRVHKALRVATGRVSSAIRSLKRGEAGSGQTQVAPPGAAQSRDQTSGRLPR
ncbi:GNAT family N-acetyltransferase [Bosea caraganae]|uniref:GNAT family N-acetyltransferase n=1 Tax=Bosea caraganae TaxID=2763117 RepID=A0A370L614_9HYPH|nr:GNAT family N-acetyltransferase [Bosea caraganae]RDJ24065.1 GNAT family N-acetyltransferase [Bosea caraganae]RDJ30107.1 GNAT family N-acetyltransferase [Bosea caraganae]